MLADYISHLRARLPDLTWSKRPPVKDGMGEGEAGCSQGTGQQPRKMLSCEKVSGVKGSLEFSW